MFDESPSFSPPKASSVTELQRAPQVALDAVQALLEAVQQPTFFVNRAGETVYQNRAARVCYPQPPGWLRRCASTLGAARAPSNVRCVPLSLPGDKLTAVVVDPVSFDVSDAHDTPWARRWRLAPRHARVAACLLAGMSDKETAAELDLSLNSARTYVQQVFHLARVHSRTGLLREAMRVSRGDAQPPVEKQAG